MLECVCVCVVSIHVLVGFLTHWGSSVLAEREMGPVTCVVGCE